MPYEFEIKLTHAQVRKLITNSDSLFTTYRLLKKTKILNKDFARVLSKEYYIREKGGLKKCKQCSKKINLTIHHKRPLTEGLTIKIILNLDNLQVLCKDCHIKKEKEPKNAEKEHEGMKNTLKIKVPRGIFEKNLNIYIEAFKQGWGKRNAIEKKRYSLKEVKIDQENAKITFQIQKLKEVDKNAKR